jgi:septum formation protein
VTKLYLASKSPRRKQLLLQLGIEFDVVDVNIEEMPGPAEHAIDYVRRIAIEKALGCRLLTQPGPAILAADTEVILDGKILGKPANSDSAAEMLLSLSGREHLVQTAVVLLREQAEVLISTSRVWFKPLTRQECLKYINCCHPLDKAGAYGIQERAAGFIHRFEGSYSGVMGLPLVETAKLLASV